MSKPMKQNNVNAGVNCEGYVNLPPLPFLFTTFTKPCHHLLLEVWDREALETLVPDRRVRGGGEKLHSLPGKILGRAIRRGRDWNRILIRHSQARNVVLKHVSNLLEPPQIQQRPRSQLKSLVQPRRDRQSCVKKVQSWSDLALFLCCNQTPSIFDVFLNNLQNVTKKNINCFTEPLLESWNNCRFFF